MELLSSGIINNSVSIHCPSFMFQLVFPAFQSVMGHLRSRTLEKFKETFDKALSGEGFSSAARDCTKFYMAEFDGGCAGTLKGEPIMSCICKIILGSDPYIWKELKGRMDAINYVWNILYA